MLYLYNSLTRSKEPFNPINPGKIGIYACGMTVYDRCHLGHARSMVCFDMMVRFLRSQGYEVTFVRNITDIDDKIIARAGEQGIGIELLTERCIQAMHEDADALAIARPDSEPRATQHMPSIIKLIERLLEKQYAYIGTNGDVYYSVAHFKGYGKLSNKDTESLISGTRVDVIEAKHSPLDFVLWKQAKANEPFWESPWGRGRPGWHIECSAMSMDALGEQFDIHGGGLDLQFPHHENEIAQSEAATGKTFANYWLHVGLLQVNYEKMAKSLGNFYTIQDVLKAHHPEVIRYFLLSSHYRSPLNYTDDNLHNACKALDRLYQSLQGISEDGTLHEGWVQRFNDAMNDDFNTPIALAVLFDLSHEINKTQQVELAATLRYLGGILGILTEEPTTYLQTGLTYFDKDAIEALIRERADAKSHKDWAKSDEIREQLRAMGVEIQDNTEGTVWRKS